MKKLNLLCLIFVVFISIFLVSCNEDDKNDDIEEIPNGIDVIVLAGQSNMEGNSLNSMLLSKTDESMHSYYNYGFENTLISYYCGKNGMNVSEDFLPVELGQGSRTYMFGPELGIAEELYERGYEKPVYLVKYSVGGTSLHTDWNTAIEGSLYYELVDFLYDRLFELEEEGYTPIIRGLFWMQGETDSCNPTLKNFYEHYLTQLVTLFRNEFEELYGVPGKGIAFVDAGISDSPDWLYYKYINQCKINFANSNPSKNYYFGTIDEGLEYDKENNDLYHYDSLSELKLGKLFISTLLDNGWL